MTDQYRPYAIGTVVNVKLTAPNVTLRGKTAVVRGYFQSTQSYALEAQDDSTKTGYVDRTYIANVVNDPAPSMSPVLAPVDKWRAPVSATKPAPRPAEPTAPVVATPPPATPTPPLSGGRVFTEIRVKELRVHPVNIRRFYPQPDVERMAGSIRSDGLIQPLQVIEASSLSDADRDLASGESGVYYVVDGNFRLVALRFLDDPERTVPCEIVEMNRAKQLLVMATSSELVIPKDAISMALHYRRMKNEEGYTITAIARAVRRSPNNIDDHLKLLELDSDIQQLVAEGKISKQRAVTEALLSIPDAKARMQLAQRMAAAGATGKVIVSAAQKVLNALKAQATERAEIGDAPALRLAVKQNGFLRMPNANATVDADTLRATAKSMCDGCEKRHAAMKHTPEPAWLQVVQASVSTCKTCEVRAVEGACGKCPSVVLLRTLMGTSGARMEGAGYAD